MEYCCREESTLLHLKGGVLLSGRINVVTSEGWSIVVGKNQRCYIRRVEYCCREESTLLHLKGGVLLSGRINVVTLEGWSRINVVTL